MICSRVQNSRPSLTTPPGTRCFTPTSFEESKPTLACSKNLTCNLQIFTMFFGRNVRIHSNNRLAELAAEFYNVDWDVGLFSETRGARGRCVLEGEHVLYTSEIANTSSWSGNIIAKKNHRVGKVTSLNEKFLFLDLHRRGRCVRPIFFIDASCRIFSGGIAVCL